MTFWNTPAGRAGLAARSMEREPLHEAMRGDTRDWCFYCKSLTDDYRRIDFDIEIRNVCGSCYERMDVDPVEPEWRDAYPDADELTLRRLAGDR